MILKVFTVYDEKAHAYLPPFFLPREEQAIRTFTDCVNAEDHQFGKHPHDYTLFGCGEFNDNTATFLVKSAHSLGNGVEFLQSIARPEALQNEIGNDARVQSDTKSGNSA